MIPGSNRPLTLPALDLGSEVSHPFSDSQDHEIKLFSNNRQLLISKREIIIIHGSTVSKKLSYKEDIISASYTTFHSNKTSDALAVCLKKQANIYYPDGRTYVVSLPFMLLKAIPFEYGLILEKDQDQPILSGNADYHHHSLRASKFLTLVDPIGTFRMVTSSSTSIISNHEELMVFPKSGLNKTAWLCASYSEHDGNVILYHIRSSSRKLNGGLNSSGSSRSSRKKNFLLSTPNPSRVLDDDIETTVNQNILSFSMDKKRTSTLLSDISSIARMGSESGFPEANKIDLELPNLKKDMTFTRQDVISIGIARSKIKIHELTFEDQEAIVILNQQTREAFAYIFKNHSNSRLQSCFNFKCIDCIPLNNSTYGGLLVCLNDESNITLINPFLDIVSTKLDTSSTFGPLKSLMSACENCVAVRTKYGKNRTLYLIMEPSNELVKSCLMCFKYLSGSKINEFVMMLWRSAAMLDDIHDDWNAFVIAFLSIVYPFQEDDEYILNDVTKLLPKARLLQSSLSLSYSFNDLIPYIALSLHILREELRLNSLRKNDLNKVGFLLSQLTVWMGWNENWTSYYLVNSNEIDQSIRFLSVLVLEYPPNLFESLASLFTDSIKNYLTFAQLVEEGEAVDELITPRTHHIVSLFELLVSPNYGPNDVVSLMCRYNIKVSDIESYPSGVYLPLKEAISICQENPAFEWTAKALDLVGRKDLSSLLKKDHIALSSHISNEAPKDINHILSHLLDRNENVSAWDGQTEADRINITKLIFDYDRRYYEITTLLHQTKNQTATLVVADGLNEYDIVVLQRKLAAIVALRTLTIPLGRAALFYGGRKPLLTEKFPIPKFNLNTLIAPQMANIILSEGAVEESYFEWGYFHNGVSSGLSISKESKGITGSWIIFNKPPELNAQHAGFLLALGLNGHLKKLEEWHIYNYLGPKHPLTSVGLLIGIAASIRGTMDNKLTKVLSVHAAALLPQGANDLNVPVIVQAAGLVGIGLLYLETQHRRMSEILLIQITSSVYHSDTEIIHEGYRLAAGIALGFVNLGKGDDLRGLNDTHVVEKLLSLAVSMRDYQPAQELDKSACGAIMALGFIYMRTGNFSVASKLKVPTSEQLLDYIRPNLLSIRCVAKNLIMFNEIGKTIEWVESEMSTSILDRFSQLDPLDSDQLAYYNILGGTCLSIAVRYASSHDLVARDTLLHYLDKLMAIVKASPTNYDQKISYSSVKNTQDLLALCASVVMAGTGDLDTFRRLRILHHDTTSDMGFGNYMAINMALGFLFLGGGQYAFSNSNLALACLVISLYPVFPNHEGEYGIYLQALRHMWALSVEPRCLNVRDVDTQIPCKIPITIIMKDGKTKEMLSPCLLPDLSEISMIKTTSTEHFNVEIDFHLNSEYLEAFKDNLTIFVYKRDQYQLLKSSVGTLLKNESRKLQMEKGEVSIDSTMSKLLKLDFMDKISNFEVILMEKDAHDTYSSDFMSIDSGYSTFSICDNKIELSQMAHNPLSMEDLWNLKLIFAYSDSIFSSDSHYITSEFIERLKHSVFDLTRQPGMHSPA